MRTPFPTPKSVHYTNANFSAEEILPNFRNQIDTENDTSTWLAQIETNALWFLEEYRKENSKSTVKGNK